MDLVFKKVLSPTLFDPLTALEYKLLKGAGYTRKEDVVDLQDSFAKILEKEGATSDIFWQWPEESTHWEDKHRQYINTFRIRLGLLERSRHAVH